MQLLIRGELYPVHDLREIASADDEDNNHGADYVEGVGVADTNDDGADGGNDNGAVNDAGINTLLAMT